ncbi:MAG TPA: glycerophosphodiester phosphodiesterase [Chloroflexota bacterium]|nr:glycerophosphodiester phosphodiesterase [Chloroflexota bacterium]HUM69505.1 glycerophosphodiester phosphodiesterase [Chloroflexota bacterium]
MWRKIGMVIGVIVVIGLVVYLILRARVEPVPAHPFFAQFETGRPLNIAHQGGEQLWPSNTMFAFQHAVEMKVDVLEMDVHQTADGVFVLIHDATVDRTTDGSGAVKEMTLAEVQTLDAGYYWTDDEGQTYPFRGQGITIPTLDEVFTAFPDMPMNIEIKPDDTAVAEALCQFIQQYNMTNKTLIGSFHDNALTAFRAACPDVATSMTESEIRPFWILSVLGLSALYQSPAEAFQVPTTANLPVLGEVDVLTERFVNNAHAQNIMVHAWTINETAEMERLLDMGLDGIITDRPDRLQEVIGKR